MRTLPIVESNPSAAWLESNPREGQQSIRAELAQLPFTIGRNESCDLTIESARISREHLRIELGSSGYLVRDLASTNGTFVNGLKVTEAPLADGDLLSVANFGLIFHLPAQSARICVTQPFGGADEPLPNPRDSSVELIEAVRELQEVTLSRGVRNRFQAIVEMATSDPIGYQIGDRLSANPATNIVARIPNDISCSAVARAHEISRTLAVEQAWNALGDVLLFLSATPREIAAPELLDSLERLKQRPSGEARLVLQVPHDALIEPEAWRELHDQLREIGVAVALDQFASAAPMLAALRNSPPDYLKLSESLVQGFSRSPEQRRRVQELVQTAGELGTRVIGCGIQTQEEWHACKSVGITLAQGDFAAAPLPLEACTKH